MASISASLAEAAAALLPILQATALSPEESAFWPVPDDPVIATAMRLNTVPFGLPQLIDATNALLRDDDINKLFARGSLQPLVIYANEGRRTSLATMVASLFASARLQILYLRLPEDEPTFVELVIEGYRQLKRAASHQTIDAHLIMGFNGLDIPEGSELNTAWGTIRSVAPPPPGNPTRLLPAAWMRRTSALLAIPQSLEVQFFADNTPEGWEWNLSSQARIERISKLLPLACALANDNFATIGAPISTFTTWLVPFGGAMAYSQPWPLWIPHASLASARIGRQIETWTYSLDETHNGSIDIAARRTLSAISLRSDVADSLMDAVMAWENLLGTGSEVSFRVTASLAKLLEPPDSSRLETQRELADIYGIRSRVMHGDAVDALKLDAAAKRAAGVALAALRASYRRGPAWLSLSSSERANRLLLQES